MWRTYYLIFFLFSVTSSSLAQSIPSIRQEDQNRILLAKHLATQYGDSIWPQFSQTPFTLLLVTTDWEYLIFSPEHVAGMDTLGYNPTLQTEIFYRKRVFDPSFLATFPVFGSTNTIVVGIPENTQSSSTEWILAVLHEHFHQYQFNQPAYHQDAYNLGLADGDQTGMWQLNYPFDYQQVRANRRFEVYTETLWRCIAKVDSKKWSRYYRKLQRARQQFLATLSPKDQTYFSFQLYQEGIARYTEWKFLELLPETLENIPEYLHSPYGQLLELREKYLRYHTFLLKQSALHQHKRNVFYDLGLLEGLIWDQVNPTWREQYLKNRFDIASFISDSVEEPYSK